MVSSRDGRQLQAAAAAAKAANVFLNGRIDGAYGDSSFCHNPRRSFITVTTARNTRQKVVAFIPNNQCGVQFYRKQYKYLALRPYASLTMLLNGGSVGGQAPLLVRSRLTCWLPALLCSLLRLSSDVCCVRQARGPIGGVPLNSGSAVNTHLSAVYCCMCTCCHLQCCFGLASCC